MPAVSLRGTTPASYVTSTGMPAKNGVRVVSVTGVSVITERSQKWDDSVTNDRQYDHKIFDRGLFGHKSEYKEV